MTGDQQLFGILGRGKEQVAYAKVDLNVVDVTSSEVVYSASGAGEYSLSNREVIGFGGSAGYDSTLNGKVLDLAIREAVDRLVDGITRRLGAHRQLGIHHDEDNGAAAPDGVRPYGSRAGDHGIGRPAGRAQQPKSLYTWEGYQPTVYAYLKEDGNDYAVQAQTLEKSVEKRAPPTANCLPAFARTWACCT